MNTRELHKERVDTHPAPVPVRENIDGQRVRLEPSDAGHIGALYQLSHVDQTDPSMWDYLPYGPFDDAEAFGRWYRAHTATDDPMLFTFRCRQADRPFGMGSFMRIAPDARSIEIGHIWICPQYQNSRQATEALFLMMRHALDTLGNRRLEWKCDAMNQPSRSAAERLGFTYEGTFYRAAIVKGRNRDTAWFSIIEEEWPALRDAHQIWLGDENFDAQGQQRRPLRSLIKQPASH